ncbi:unnamed protein product [Ceutorhynchus assimilis]|uniref:DNA/RNA non-specific endonuclease/pyrophosphatase/phosphodiesterase domain-containing protein n=1 Tax=Ceutorhynchus assimilis TaxID=467358 RepID=A0A9N9MHU5_9CUCU|nr:unnamed protein product [Ceutorhynchus assimilis]
MSNYKKKENVHKMKENVQENKKQKKNSQESESDISYHDESVEDLEAYLKKLEAEKEEEEMERIDLLAGEIEFHQVSIRIIPHEIPIRNPNFLDCQFDTLNLKPTPLIFNRNAEIIYRNSPPIQTGQQVNIACPGNQLLYLNENLGPIITASCIEDSLLFQEKPLNLYSLRCRDIPQNTIRYTGRSCKEGGEEIEVGYNVPGYGFLRQMRICFDNVNFSPIFSHYTLTKTIGYRDSKVPRKFFEEDGFYSTSESLDNLYNRNRERRTINELLGLESQSTTYIKQNGELFINRGHLTPKGDFVYAYQQLATFHYANSAPQWASFNGGNWNELEMSLRDYASSTNSDLEVYTGVHGVSTLTNNANKIKTELFLHTNNGRHLLPVPQLFWKLIYDKHKNSGIVILGVNNAYEVQREDFICEDISDRVSWFSYKLKGQKNRVDLGHIYACSIEDFRRAVGRSPNLNAANLLFLTFEDFQNLIINDPGCHINIRDLPQRKPLLRDPSTLNLLLPDNAGSSIITLSPGKEFEIDCPGSNILVDDNLALGEVAIAECVGGSQVLISNRRVDFSTVVCSRRIASVARYTGKRCWNNKGKETEVGFVFTDGHFIREMNTCFDPMTRNVYYSLFEMSHQIGDQNTGGTRPGWTEGAFYNLGTRLDNLYPNAAQRSTINSLVGLPNDSTKYVRPTGSYYLARGHLTARADFMYYAQQEATFHYVNSVPQWQTFNGFNWAYFEANVRQLSARTGSDLIVQTGSYGISTLPHEKTNHPVELYLFADGQKAMPVPKLFWKVVYSPSTRRGVAVLGVNNPFLKDLENEIICPDVADQLNWLSFDRFNTVRGYIYACTIADIRKVIPQIPNYDARGILNL